MQYSQGLTSHVTVYITSRNISGQYPFSAYSSNLHQLKLASWYTQFNYNTKKMYLKQSKRAINVQ